MQLQTNNEVIAMLELVAKIFLQNKSCNTVSGQIKY